MMGHVARLFCLELLMILIVVIRLLHDNWKSTIKRRFLMRYVVMFVKTYHVWLGFLKVVVVWSDRSVWRVETEWIRWRGGDGGGPRLCVSRRQSFASPPKVHCAIASGGVQLDTYKAFVILANIVRSIAFRISGI